MTSTNPTQGENITRPSTTQITTEATESLHDCSTRNTQLERDFEKVTKKDLLQAHQGTANRRTKRFHQKLVNLNQASITLMSLVLPYLAAVDLSDDAIIAFRMRLLKSSRNLGQCCVDMDNMPMH
jgi:hypothetical protein